MIDLLIFKAENAKINYTLYTIAIEGNSYSLFIVFFFYQFFFNKNKKSKGYYKGKKQNENQTTYECSYF